MFKYMVVDDEELERKAIQIIIKRRELPLYCVAEACHGAEAVEKAVAARPDLVFMDIKMPGMNGLEAAQEILGKLPGCQVVFLTAYDQFEYARKGLQIGAADYLLKPVRPDMLEGTCNKVIDNLEYSRQQKEERDRLQKEIDSSQPFVQNALIYNLLSGNYSNYEQYKAKLENLNLDLKSGSVMVISIDRDHKSQMNQVSKVIAEMVEKSPYSFIVPINTGRIAILLGQKEQHPGMSTAGLKKLALELRQTAAEKSGVSINIGIGRIYSDLWDMEKSYAEACNAVNLADLLQGNNSVLHINECDRYYHNIPDYSLEEERKLIDMVNRGDIHGSMNSIEEIFQNFFRSFSQNLLWAKARCLQLVGVLCKTAVDAGVDSEEIFQLNATMVHKLLDITEMEPLKKWIKDCTADIAQLITKSRELSSNRVIKTTQEYIEQNLHRNITLEDICKLVYLNPQYFSRFFRKETGMTFVEYLTQRRMERAKVLLKEEGLPVAVVAKKVGFADANYFSRVFCKVEGVPPSEYAKSKK